ncbi:MAG: hypothetical protein ACRDLE_01065 [Gaiellaceae bacterium]
MPPELVFPPELFGATVLPPELFAAWPLGAAPLLATCATGVLPLLAGVALPPGVAVPELLPDGAV